MKRIIITSVLSFAILACNDKKDKIDSKHLVDKQEAKKENITLGYTQVPEVIKDCSCKISLSEKEFQEGKFVYIDDYGNTAYITIDNKELIFQLDDDFDLEKFNKTLEDDTYTISLQTENHDVISRKFSYKGDISIKNKITKEATTIPIYGECECK